MLTTAVRALDGYFVHDNDEFVEKDRFGLVLTLLVEHDGSMRELALETVSPRLATKSDLLWKPLHYAVLMKSYGKSAVVRFTVLVAVKSVTR